MSKKDSFIIGRIKSIGYATKGAFLLVTSEASVKVQFFIGIVMTIAGFYYEISKTEWIIQILTIATIMALEGLNTAIEKLCDFVHSWCGSVTRERAAWTIWSRSRRSTACSTSRMSRSYHATSRSTADVCARITI